jgi:hypothetical protein
VPYANTLDALDDSSRAMFFWISEDIVAKVLGEILFDPLESKNMSSRPYQSLWQTTTDQLAMESVSWWSKGYGVRAGC